MDEKIRRASEIVSAYGQEHLLDAYERLETKEEKEEFLETLFNIDFDQIQRLYEQTKLETKQVCERIQPANFIDGKALCGKKRKMCEEIGESEIKDGKLAVVTMAGGQGTRLGHNGPKGTFDIGLRSHKSIFEILTDTMLEGKEKYDTYVPWYIMTSEENHQETVDFFEKNNFFGYPKEDVVFFKQSKLPMVDTNGKILIDTNGQIKEAANGHGGVFEALSKSGALDDMKSRGVQWVFIGGVDNILVQPIDAAFIGVLKASGLKVGAKSVVKRNPQEKVGVFCRKDGKPGVIEYSEISKKLAEATNPNGELKYSESHILNNMFNIQILEELRKCNLEYHVALKKASHQDKDGNIIVPTEPNAYKFETFMFDAFERINDMIIYRVERNKEFAPIKNKEGQDSPETARKMYQEEELRKARKKRRLLEFIR